MLTFSLSLSFPALTPAPHLSFYFLQGAAADLIGVPREAFNLM